MIAVCNIAPCILVEVDRRRAIALMMEAVRISETSVHYHETTLRYIPESCHVQSYFLADTTVCRRVEARR
jgi:hypothetical protein